MWVPEAPLPDNTRLLSGEWTGNTFFRILRPEAFVGFKWCADKLIKCRETTRPDDIDPELWKRSMSKLQGKHATAEWQVTLENIAEARPNRGLIHVLEEETGAWSRIMKDKLDELSMPLALAMTI